MLIYPILKAPNCNGFTTICNFPANNWELSSKKKKLINLIWAYNDKWHSKVIGELEYGFMQTIKFNNILDIPNDAFPILSLTDQKIPSLNELFPKIIYKTTQLPAWRATVGLETSESSTSFQGEIMVFPSHGSLLSFVPLIQYGSEVENYLIFLNLESSPIKRKSFLEFYIPSERCKLINKFIVYSNSINIINLKDMNIRADQLLVIACKGMSGIPLIFSKTQDGKFVSLEHTHPPASLVVHGDRNELQKRLKKIWFSRLSI